MIRKSKYKFLIFGAIILIGFSLKGKIAHEKFVSEKWKNWKQSEEEWSLRWDMMNSLRNKHELIGKNKSEIIGLLGKPNFETENEFGYFLGMTRLGIDVGNLTIKFDKNENVSKFKVRRS